MGDKKDSTLVAQAFKRPVEGQFVRVVEAGRSFVEDQNRCFGQQRASNSNALPLAARKRVSRIAALALIALWQSADKTIGLRQFRGGNHLRLTGLRATKADVFLNGSGEQRHILRHPADEFAQRRQRQGANVTFTNLNRAAGRLPKAQKQVG